MLTENQRIKLIGALGEDVVNSVLKEAGFNVQKSIDRYDSEKDFLVENLKIEVKTVVPWFTENALTIDASQFKKCYNADYVIFVCVPTKGLTNISNTKYDGNIYVINPKEVTWRTKETKNGLSKYLVNINQSGVKLCHKITNSKVLNRMKSLTLSKA
jgi:hypothetical protein